MIRNFFKVAVRNFLRQKLYSIINVLGLASGLTCALFIYLWVNDEISKDAFHQHGKNIFQVMSNLHNDGNIVTWDITPGPLAEDIREHIPDAEMVARTQGTGDILFQYQDKSFMERGYFADPDFFNIFSFDIIHGKPAKESDITSISISESLARKFFGNEDPIGKTLKLNNRSDYTITAVFKDVTSESSLRFSYVLPFEVLKKSRDDGFNMDNYDYPLYLKISDPTKSESIAAAITARVKELSKEDGGNVSFYLQPFSEHYLNSVFADGKPAGGRVKYVKIFSLVAIFILVIACINFMNMATAKAANRSKEVGIRKVVGAQRKSLVVQFISESVLISFVSMLLALGVVYSLLPLFNLLVVKSISLSFSDGKLAMVIVSIILITGILAGSYPAFFLSAFQPAHVLKGSVSAGLSGASIRRALVIFQFALTVILVASSLVVYNQIEFIRNKNIGYDRQSVMWFETRGNIFKEFSGFRNEALQHAGIKNVSKANESLVQVNNQNGSVGWPGKPDNSRVFFRTVVADIGYLETMGLKLQQGRFFSKDFNDTSNFVLTERAVEVMGLKDPIGQTISQWGFSGKVVGVVSDFHSRSLHETMDPIVFFCKPEWTGLVFVRFDGKQTQDVIAHLEKIYKKYNPAYPFTYNFLEDDFERLYNNEKVMGSLALGFTVMAIIISGLGLVGLAAYTAEKRRKEIGIRKTLGASVTGIVSMISKDFVKLSLVAVVIGCPVAYYFMQEFLAGYAYHADLSWEIFAITAVSVIVMAVFTVIFQVTKAAIANPVDALRSE
jgi:putative ABC transport system permease protein